MQGCPSSTSPRGCAFQLSTEDLVADGLLNVRQAAAFLGISRSKLYSLVERDELPYVKLARLGAFRREP
ncbi:helix-turn-helix domain-containing protein [Geochorda subterranea]|uniref:helix-turn-helix domain-containing protein n=1 Tax=Geochorda subterranea TaxID=3109564 RepID=UPI00386010B5